MGTPEGAVNEKTRTLHLRKIRVLVVQLRLVGQSSSDSLSVGNPIAFDRTNFRTSFRGTA